MIRWLTALFFSVVIHLGILFGYSAFTQEKNDPTKRKITNVNFLESEIDEKAERYKPKIAKPKTKKENTKQVSKEVIEEIKENSNIQIITKDKNDQEIFDLLNELILDFKEQNNLKKIESLEKELINNLDENSYAELIKLKSQRNRE